MSRAGSNSLRRSDRGSDAADFARPRATMRLQLHKDFTFADAKALIPYMVDLGISHVYSSPILTARAGSIHGYDVVDPTSVNPELGGEHGSARFRCCAAGGGAGADRRYRPEPHGGGRSPTIPGGPICCATAAPAAMRISSTWTGNATIRTCAARCWRRSSAGRMARPWRPGKSSLAQSPRASRWFVISTTISRSIPMTMPMSPNAGSRSFDPANAGGRCQLHTLAGAAALSPGVVGRRRATKSTGGGSSISTAWQACGSKIRKCSRQPTPRCSGCMRMG